MRFEMKKVQSEALDSYGYYAETGTLKVKFPSGPAVYYHGVSKKIFEQLELAKSKGKYWSQNIRDRYIFTYHSGRRNKGV